MDYKTFFQPERDKLKSGLVDTQMGIEEVVPDPQRVALRKKVRPMNQHPASERVTLQALLGGVLVVILSGMKGSGVVRYAKQVMLTLKACGVAVQRIDTDLLLGERGDECDLCI